MFGRAHRKEYLTDGINKGCRYLHDKASVEAVQRIVLCAVLFVGLLVAFPFVRYWGALALTRLFETYPIGWLEPLFYKSALRVYDGLPVYGPPALDYIAPIYGPGLGVTGGLLFKIFGPGYPVLRVASVVSLMGLILVSGLWVKKVSGSWLWSWVPGVLLLMLDRPMNFWFMRINVDIPYLCLVFAAFFLIHSYDLSRKALISAGICMALASLFKQNALVMAFAIGLYVLIRDRKAAIIYMAAMAAVLIPAAIALHLTSDGWFWTITGRIPTESLTKIDVKWLGNLKKVSMPGLAGFGVSAVLLTFLDKGVRRFFWPLIAAAMVAVSYKAFAKDGGGQNGLLPILLSGAIMPWLALGLARQHLVKFYPDVVVDQLAVAAVFIVLFIVAPAGEWKLPERKQVSIPKFSNFNKKIEDVVVGTEGPIFVGARPDVLYRAGRPQNFHQTTLYEGTYRTSVYDMEELIAKPLSEHRWDKMILWDYGEKQFNSFVAKYYKKTTDLGVDPLIGVRVSVWLPKHNSALPPRNRRR